MDERRILRLLGSRGTITILRYLNEHSTAQYHHFNQFIITSTLNKRLRQLLHFNLINHYFMKEGVIKRKEWSKSQKIHLDKKSKDTSQNLIDLTEFSIKNPDETLKAVHTILSRIRNNVKSNAIGAPNAERQIVSIQFNMKVALPYPVSPVHFLLG